MSRKDFDIFEENCNALDIDRFIWSPKKKRKKDYVVSKASLNFGTVQFEITFGNNWIPNAP